MTSKEKKLVSRVEPAFAQKYMLHEELGRGSYAIVHRCTEQKSKEPYAVKIVDKSKATPAQVKGFTEEFQIMNGLTHKHIVTLNDVMDTSSALYIVLELVRGGDLFHIIAKLTTYSESTAARLMNKFLDALAYLHSNNICHRDLKPDNILLSRPITTTKLDPKILADLLTDIKVADFGFATRCDGDTLEKCCGTPYYIAPEILNFGVYKTGPPYGKQCDIWSAGVIAYVLLCGAPPFQAEKREQLFQLIVRGEFRFSSRSGVSDEGKDFVKHLLILDPRKRPVASKAVQHSWIQHHCGPSVLPPAMSDMKPAPPSAPKSEGSRSGGGSAEQQTRTSLPTLSDTHRKIRTFGKEHPLKAAVFGVEAIHRLAYLSYCKQLGIKPNSGILGEMEGREGEHESEEIDLSRNYTGGRKGVTAIMGAVASKKTLKKLVLKAQEIDNTSVEILVQTLQKHPSVTHIDLSNNPLSRTGAKKLQEMAQRNRHIVRMDLEGTDIHPDRIAMINQILAQNRAAQSGGGSAASGNTSGLTTKIQSSSAANSAGSSSKAASGSSLPPVK